MRVNVSNISPAEYLSLRPKAIDKLRAESTVEVICTEVAELEWQVLLVLAPRNRAWGMEIPTPKRLEQWIYAQHCRDDAPALLKKFVRRHGVELSQLLRGILCYWAHPENSEIVFEHGTEHELIKLELFDTQIIPVGRASVLEFKERLESGISDLDFFLLADREDAKRERADSWDLVPPYRVWAHLLLSAMPRKSLSGASDPSPEAILKELRAAQAMSEAEVEAKVRKEASSHWLRAEPIDLDLSSLNRENIRAAALLGERLGVHDLPELNAERRQIAALRLKLLCRLKWPIGIRNFHKFLSELGDDDSRLLLADIPEFMSDLSNLVAEAKERYPVLFPD